MLIYGINSILETLRGSPDRVQRLIIDKGKKSPRISEIVAEARSRRIPFSFEPSSALDRRSGGEAHQGVMAELTAFNYAELDEVLASDPTRIILLDGVEDPRNLGAVIRTAEASGADAVLIPSRNSCGITGTVMKSSAGAASHIPVCRVTNVARTIALLKDRGFWAVGLDMEGREELPGDIKELPLLLIGGGENRGLRPLVKSHCDFLFRLPMKGKVSSLNLSVAVGILIYSLLGPGADTDHRQGES